MNFLLLIEKKITMTEIKYEDYKNLIYKIAWTYHRKTGVDFEELVSEGNIAFCNAKKNFNPNKNIKFCTYLYCCLKNQMKDFVDKQNNHCDFNEIKFYLEDKNSQFQIKLFENLSDSSKIIVKTIINPPEEIIKWAQNDKWPKKRDGKKHLSRYFREKGWKFQDIWNSFNEIQTVLGI